MLTLPTTLIQQFGNLLKISLFPKNTGLFTKNGCASIVTFATYAHRRLGYKFQHYVFQPGSFPLFLQKLKNKNQSVQQQIQAKHSDPLFFEIYTASEQLLLKDRNISILSEPHQCRVNLWQASQLS